MNPRHVYLGARANPRRMLNVVTLSDAGFVAVPGVWVWVGEFSFYFRLQSLMKEKSLCFVTTWPYTRELNYGFDRRHQRRRRRLLNPKGWKFTWFLSHTHTPCRALRLSVSVSV